MSNIRLKVKCHKTQSRAFRTIQLILVSFESPLTGQISFPIINTVIHRSHSCTSFNFRIFCGTKKQDGNTFDSYSCPTWLCYLCERFSAVLIIANDYHLLISMHSRMKPESRYYPAGTLNTMPTVRQNVFIYLNRQFCIRYLSQVLSQNSLK